MTNRKQKGGSDQRREEASSQVSSLPPAWPQTSVTEEKRRTFPRFKFSSDTVPYASGALIPTSMMPMMDEMFEA